MKIKDIRLFGSDESSPSPWLTLNRIFISYTPLLGAITDDVRAVAIKWNEKDKYLLLRYYFSSFPSDEDKKMASDALAEIVSHACFEIKKAESECVHSLAPVKELDQLDGWLHLKKENDRLDIKKP